jgi:sugar lactone lactonase YvrE
MLQRNVVLASLFRRRLSHAGLVVFVVYAPCALAGASSPAPTAVAKLLYAAITSRGEVDVYKASNKRPHEPIYSFYLTPGTMSSLVVDGLGNLFLADSYSTWVFEYAPGATAPTKRFRTSGTPSGVALNGQTLYVYQSAPSGGAASIAIYKGGSTTVTDSLTDSRILYPQGIAVDAAGNVFVGWGGAKFTSGVGEFVAGKMPMHRLAIPKMDPLALAIDSSGDLVVDAIADETTSTMYIFPPGKTVASRAISGLPWFYQFSFSGDAKSFYGGDANARSFQRYSYPAGALIYNFNDKDAQWGFSGIASAPAPQVGTW